MTVDSKTGPTPAPTESETRAWSQVKLAELAARQPSFWKKHRFSVAGLAVGAAILVVGAFVGHDLRQTHAQIQKLYAGSMRDRDRIGELQYQMQESRRCLVFALAAPDPD